MNVKNFLSESSFVFVPDFDKKSESTPKSQWMKYGYALADNLQKMLPDSKVSLYDSYKTNSKNSRGIYVKLDSSKSDNKRVEFMARNHYFKIEPSDSKLIETAIAKIVRRILSESKVNKKSIKEATSGVNIALPNCNLYVKGWGIDRQGNMRIIVGFPNDKGFPIQTNGVLKETHYILQRAHKELSDDELQIIGSEVLAYVQKRGPATVKSRLKVYQ